MAHEPSPARELPEALRGRRRRPALSEPGVHRQLHRHRTGTGRHPRRPRMRERTKTGVLEKVSHEEVLKDEFTLDELNDLNNYLAWNIWDVLVMRATEGVSGMIPRQEYEILSFMQEFYRYPEFMRMMTDQVGAPGIMDIGASARTEIGTKINCVHDWCLGAVAFGMGRCGLLALEVIKRRRLRRGIQHHPQVHAAGAVGQAAGRLHPQLPGPLPLPDPRPVAHRPGHGSGRSSFEEGSADFTAFTTSTPPPNCSPSSTTTTAGSAWATPGRTRCRTGAC